MNVEIDGKGNHTGSIRAGEEVRVPNRKARLQPILLDPKSYRLNEGSKEPAIAENFLPAKKSLCG